ncbi:putative leucine-rich repeat protein kinase family protein precursor [Zea mays]|uniref:Putative LRR receptor-like serine/threonine-protein kinase n=2 Tax=Zea mays TaxID=4577 RepID=C4J1X5_MAIZE|nr:putative leucine-rich repeat protein kinase family protein precursor [Zea mays]ACR35175.1 unknown [Zea mays]ONM08747.1 putative LRR receptor-like serine/threonine-protein kinase [Zea mays]|eukprot:NP_001182936.1 putative leucine-rich repeat protein kinase family protein precursor [Zea mays]
MMRDRARGLWALLLVALAAAPWAVLAQGNLTSRSDLAGLYALRGSLGLRARDWPRRADPCTAWAGVGCRAGRVVSLNLAGLRRTRLGRLSPRFDVDGLRNLTRLEAFNASGFGLPGSIPAWLGDGLAPTFQSLDISACAVSGEIPASALVGLGNLTTLNFAGNQLSGQLPATALSRLTRLRTLNLSSNAFSGALPDAVWSLPGLSVLDVSRNNLTGALPTAGFALPANAQVVDLSSNLFYSGVPETFRRLFAQLLLANISGNYFDGKLGVSDGGGGPGGNVSFQSNCFLDVLGQRTQADCQQFYAKRGLPYDGPVIPPAPQPAPSPARKKNRNLKYILIGAIGGSLLLIAGVAAIVFCFVCSVRTGRTDGQRESGASPSAPAPSVVSATGTAAATGGTHPSALSTNMAKVGDSFAYDQIANATSGFGEERLIKHGHSGDLYHGVLQDGTAVVVKRITLRVARKDAYMAELDLFAKGLHERLVPFLGHCLDKEEEKVLVYRFVRNGDLSSALHKKSREEDEGLQSLDWIKRLKIATGVAEALCYLHHECSPPMVHRDVQASSILLDDKFDVRLGSLSEVCPQEGEGHQNVITKLLRFSSTADQGSSGSPSATCPYDVYCFGKVLLELVTGRLGISASNDASTSEWLDATLRYVNIYEKELMSKIIDPTLIIDEDHLEEVWAMAIVAKSCLNPRSSKRPPMKYILKALENPLKVVREDNGNGSGRLRATSSRGSWNAALFGSWRHSSSDIGPSREDNILKRSETIKSSGGSNGDHSSSRRRQSKEIFPEPSGSRDTED